MTREGEFSSGQECSAVHAKLTDEVGVCMATSGPGAIHLLNGLYDAKLDHRPVVAIVGQQVRMSLGGDYMQEVDLPNLFKDVAESEYEEPPRQHGAVFSGGGFPSPPRLIPEDEDLRRAAEVLNSGQKVAMLVGAGARHAAE